MVATPDSPARLCLNADPPTMRELRQGDRPTRRRRACVRTGRTAPREVRDFARRRRQLRTRRSDARCGPSVARLLGGGKGPATTFSGFPGGTGLDDRGRPSSFRQVAFDAPAGTVKGAMADVGIELADESKAPKNSPVIAKSATGRQPRENGNAEQRARKAIGPIAASSTTPSL